MVIAGAEMPDGKTLAFTYILNSSGAVQMQKMASIDPATGNLTDVATLPEDFPTVLDATYEPVSKSLLALAAWSTDTRPWLIRIDPATAALTHLRHLSDVWYSLAADGQGRLFLVRQQDGALGVLFNPLSGQEPVPVGRGTAAGAAYISSLAFDRDAYLAGDLAPVFFGSAINNFGVRELLECFIDIAPSPRPSQTETRRVEPAEEKMTGFVFKIHANMDPNHRDRIAFLKICSGRFERNRNYLHVRSGKQLKFSSPTAFMAEKKSVIDEAYPGDIVGLHDTGTFKIGDTFTEGEKLKFTGIPSFAPEQFRYIENADPLKFKQLAKGVDQLMDEGVAQLFTSQLNGRRIIGTVGALQFEVIQYRLEHEYGAKCRWEPISIYKACWIESDDAGQLADFKRRKHTNMAVDKHGRDVFLADTSYALTLAQENFKEIRFKFTSEF